MGSKKPVILCEGEIGGQDYLLYNALFSKDFYIKPSGTCENIKKVLNVLKKDGLMLQKTIGIIDRDFLTDENIADLDEDLYVLEVNEIEMLYIVPELLETVFDFDDKRILGNIYSEFDKECVKHLEKQAVDFCKFSLAGCIELSKSSKYSKLEIDIENLKSSLENYRNIYDDRHDELKQIYEGTNYLNKLKSCNLKSIIFNNVIRKYDPHYYDRCISRIQNNEILKSKLKNYIRNKNNEIIN